MYDLKGIVQHEAATDVVNKGRKPAVRAGYQEEKIWVTSKRCVASSCRRGC
jgi:hypothetical protein